MACGWKHPLFLDFLLLLYQDKRSSPRGNERDDDCFSRNNYPGTFLLTQVHNTTMLQLKVETIKWEFPDTATFLLRETHGKKINYTAGQFLTLIFDHHRNEIRRSYSLTSSPDEHHLAITIQRIANGEISRFMLAKIKP